MSARSPSPRPSTSSAAASPARTSATPASAPDSTASAPGCGASSPGSFAWYDRDSSSWRTSQRSLFGGWTEYSETWPKAGSMRNGTVSARPRLARLTSETGSSSSHGPHVAQFPTPSATSYGSSGNGTGNNIESRGRPSLATMARTGMWPTPLATDAKGAQPLDRDPRHGDKLATAVKRWPTPVRSDADRGPTVYSRGNPGLLMAARRWPTPTAGDAKGSGSRNLEGSKAHAGVSLTDAFRAGTSTQPRSEHEVTGQLNPTWVEWLMGFPGAWTASGHSATRSSRRSGRSSDDD